MNGALCGAVLGVLMLVGSGSGTGMPKPMRAQDGEGGTASLRVRNWLCPVGHSGENLKEVCTTPDERFFVLAGNESLRGTSMFGEIAWDNVAEGEYVVWGGVAVPYLTNVVVACFSAQSPDRPYEPRSVDQRGILLYLGANEHVVCDWWNLVHTMPPSLDGRNAPTFIESKPSPQHVGSASIEVDARLCPASYEGTGSLNYCVPPPVDDDSGWLALYVVQDWMDVSGELLVAQADDRGTVAFGNLVTAPALVGSQPLGLLGLHRHEMTCRNAANTGAEFAVTPIENAYYPFDLEAGDRWECTLYTWAQQEAGSSRTSGSVTVYTAACPPGYRGDDYFADCYENAVPNPAFTLLELDWPGFFDTGLSLAVGDSKGFAFFDGLDGTFRLRNTVSGSAHIGCSQGGKRLFTEDSTNEDGIFIEVRSTDDIRCDWYIVPPE